MIDMDVVRVDILNLFSALDEGRKKELLEALFHDNAKLVSSLPQVVRAVVEGAEVKNAVLANHRLLGELVGEVKLRTVLLEDPRATKSFIHDGRIKRLFAENEEFLGSALSGGFVSKSQIVAAVKRDRDLLHKILCSPTVRGMLAEEAKLLWALLEDGRIKAQLSRSAPLVAGLFNALDIDHTLILRSRHLKELAKKMPSEILDVLLSVSGESAELGDNKFISVASRFSELGNFLEVFEDARQHLDFHGESTVEKVVQKILHGSKDHHNLFRAVFERDGHVILSKKLFEISDWRGFWVAFNEIFMSQDYFFETSNPSPLIIDAGANIGVATAYFNEIYPGARILCFEPLDSIREILRRNVSRLNNSKIQVLPYALGGVEGSSKFLIPSDDSLAGALCSDHASASCMTQDVEVRSLRSWLLPEDRVHFLKLDVEGAEIDVMADIEDQLHKVERIFIEYHGSPSGAPVNFAYLMDLLARHGYRYHVTKAMGTDIYTANKPFSHLDGSYSLVIFANKIGLR